MVVCPGAVAMTSVVATGALFAFSMGSTSTVTKAETGALRPSEIEYSSWTRPTKPAAGTTCTASRPGLTVIVASPVVSSADVTTKTSLFGSVVVRQDVNHRDSVDASADLIVDGDRWLVRPRLVISIGPLDFAFGVGILDLGLFDLGEQFALAVGIVVVAQRVDDQTPVVDLLDSERLVDRPSSAVGQVVHPDPTVDEPQAKLTAGSFEKLGFNLVTDRRKRRWGGDQHIDASPMHDRSERTRSVDASPDLDRWVGTAHVDLDDVALLGDADQTSSPLDRNVSRDVLGLLEDNDRRDI